PNLVIGAAGMIDDSVVAGAVTSKLLLPRELDGAELAEPPGPLSGPNLAMRRQRTEQAHICLGMRALSYMHPDRYVLDLLHEVLSAPLQMAVIGPFAKSAGFQAAIS